MAIVIFEYVSLWKCILLYFLSILVHSIGMGLITGKKSLDTKYVLLRQAGVKQKCCYVLYPLWEKNIIFHYFKDIWLIIT